MEKDVIGKALKIDNKDRLSKNAEGSPDNYSDYLYEMIYKKYEKKDAEKIYQSILDHKNAMEKKLERKVSFIVAAADYDAANPIFKKARLIDKSLVNQLSEIAIYDVLTGLYKRGVFDSLLVKEIKKHRRHKKPLSLLLLDIDDFKVVNDTYGHQEGDLVLQELGEVFMQNSRLYDIECRYGGEELVAILTGTSVDEALIIAERLRKDIEKHFESKVYKVTVSIGVAELEPKDEASDFIRKADQALYEAKKLGKNQSYVFQSDSN